MPTTKTAAKAAPAKAAPAKKVAATVAPATKAPAKKAAAATPSKRAVKAFKGGKPTKPIIASL